MTTLNINTRPWHLSGDFFYRDDQTILTDAGRATPLAPLTVMSRVAASGKLVPLTNVAAVDGSALPVGIFIGESIPAATIVAGDVLNQHLMNAGDELQIDQAKVILENSLTLDTVITAVANGQKTIRQYLVELGIFTVATRNQQLTQPIA